MCDRFILMDEQDIEGLTLVKDKVSGVLCVRKELDYYDMSVFSYLKENHDPHIPQIYDYREQDGRLIVIESYIKGRTLGEYLEQESPDRNEKLRIIREVLDGIEFLHNAPVPIIHRDIKTDNIIIDEQGNVRVIDYDAAKTFKPGESKDTTLIGTVGSAAPEQFGFAQSDPRTDIYALGVLIRGVFDSDDSFGKVVTKATRMDPDQRFQTIDELRRALFAAASKDKKSRRPVIMIASFIAAAALIAGSLIIVRYINNDNYDVVVLSSVPSYEADVTSSDSADQTTAPDDMPSSMTESFSESSGGTDAYPSSWTIDRMTAEAKATNEENGYRYSRQQLISDLASRTKLSEEAWGKVVDSLNIDWDHQAARANDYYYARHDNVVPNDVVLILYKAHFTPSQITQSFNCNMNIGKYEDDARTRVDRMVRKVEYAYKSEYSKALKDLGYTDMIVKDAMNHAELELSKLISGGKVINDVNP